MSIWDQLDRLIDEAPGIGVLRAHALHLLAAQRWRSLARPIPGDLLEQERRSAVTALVVPSLLERIRDACEGKIVILKGPEVAALYPDPALRTFNDLDLLVEDADAAQRQLLAAGFEEVADPPWVIPGGNADRDPFANIQHARPVLWPGVPLPIELHRWPNWPRWLDLPPVPELLASSVPATVEIDGVSTLLPEYHALVLVAHSWTHEPLTRMRDIVDIALMTDAAGRNRVAAVADGWGMRRVWNSTISIADACLQNGTQPTLSQRIWARNLDPLRERTVFESHLESWVSGFWAVPPLEALKLLAGNLLGDLRPATGEQWGPKLARTASAFKNALKPKSAHDRQLGGASRRLKPSRPRRGRSRR
jgi:hypothetical protein